ncbi:hypothetical protein DIZ27_37835 [Streptomyces sp. NWU339]|uniref:hypothetical protein n=1 Tax=Streptomyces sp. NWU339 TaxID=2185284 RepID=UPI000D67ECE0|nr:hypothetical protein [Streptomyces sp. NWU339]PWI05693.1 hypothetical protein DIZ27_37835 [Streptomyces sp. NWU339]
MNGEKQWYDASPRGVVLGILGMVTLSVAILSVAVSYDILQPKFGAWAVPTVGALDALWVVFQATEILAGNNRARVRRVQAAGLALTAVNAAIPTADLILSRADGFDLAVVLTPIAIVATKTAWWIALPSLGRKVSAGTQQAIDIKRQEVADRLEEMEAEAAHRIELLELATTLEKQVAEAETRYRKSVLKTQQKMTEKLHGQAEATASTVTEQALPPSVAAIRLPELGTWTPEAPALPGTADRDAFGPDMPALPAGRDASTTGGTGSHAGQDGFASGRDGVRHTGRDADRDAVTLADLAAVTGVPTPEPGEQLTDGQLDVVLRHLRYHDDPPLSYRQAVTTFRDHGFVGSEKRVRRAWGALLSNEETPAGVRTEPAEPAEASEDADSEDESEDADA